MKKLNTGFIFVLSALISVSFTTCHNEWIQPWWEDDNRTIPADTGTETETGGGSGENFGVVVFDTDGGTPQPKALRIVWDSVVGRLRPINMPDYGFVGWYDENDALWDVETRPVTRQDDVNGDGFITLKAGWSNTLYTVKFVTGTDSKIDDQTVAANGLITQPVVPQPPDGKGFAGWFTEDTYTHQWNFATYPVEESDVDINKTITLYAKWESNTRTVQFQSNGGTRPDGVTQLTHTQTISVNYGYIQDPGPLVKTGCSFAGWYANSGFADQPWDFANNKITSLNPDPFILYAKWTENVYFVNFVITPSTAAAPQQQSVPHGGGIAQPNNPLPPGDGSYFSGWYTVNGTTHAEGWNQKYMWSFLYGIVTETMTLYAKWEVSIPEPEPGPKPGGGEGSGDNFGVVVFDTDGGTPQPRAVKIAWDNVIGRLRPVSRGIDGFLGWYDENDNLWDVETRPVTQADDVDGDGFITLIIKWDDAAYTVQFVPYPEPITPPDGAEYIPTQYVALHGKIVQPVEPIKYNTTHGFAGWYTAGNSLWDFTIGVESDVTLYAKWEENTRTVRFEANGGTRPDGYTELTHEFIVSFNYGLAQDPGPLVKPGYSFGGWYIDPGFSGLPWNFAKKITDSDVPQTNPLTFYANWVKNQYIVKFDITPSTGTAPSPETVDHGNTVTQPDNPQQLGDGRIFAGWYTENTYINQWDFNRPVTGNLTLFAQFMPVTRTVVFNVNGGNDMPRTHFSIPAGNKILDPGNPVRTGFTFTGWFADPTRTGSAISFANYIVEVPDEIIGIDPLYFYAGWALAPRTVTFYIDGTQDASLSQSVQYGERAERPDVDNPINKTLDGWYKNSNFTGSWDFDNDTVTSNTSLYARWLDAGFVVRYYLGTGSGDSSGKIPQFGTPEGQPYLEHYYRAGDKVIEPYMPALPANDTASWSFLRWDVIPYGAAATDVSNITAGGNRRGVLQQFGMFNQPIDTYLTYTENNIRVLNLYARWVPPVPDMVWVPKGSFIMGDSSVSGTPAAYHAYPTRRVILDGFYISKYEVAITNSPSDRIIAYGTLMGSNPSQFSKDGDRPVERVSWYDAINYCMKLTASSGLSQVYSMSILSSAPISGTGNPGISSITNATVTQTLNGRTGYRLPTEAEWEYAARGGNGSPDNYAYSGSNSPDAVAWYNETVKTQPAGRQSTQPFGNKLPNALGLYDMSGNVSEWVWDWFGSYKDSYFSTSAALRNPKGPDIGTERVRRGGSWSNAAGNVRSVVRNSDTPDTANWVVGFRVVRSPSQTW